MKWFRDTAGFAVGLFAIGCCTTHCSGCKPAQLGATAAESAYTGELLRCVDNASTLAESRACRDDVNKRWGIVETASKDGGR